MDHGPLVPVLSSAVDLNWLPYVARRTIFDAKRVYRCYNTVIGDDQQLPVDVIADVVGGHGGIIAQEVLWESFRGSSYTVRELSGIVKVSVRLSNTVSTSGSEMADVVQGIVDGIETCHADTTEAEEEVEW